MFAYAGTDDHEALPLGKSSRQRIPLVAAEAAVAAVSDNGDAENLFSLHGVIMFMGG